MDLRIPAPRMVGRECERCKKAFTARAADVARGWGRFCSKSCKAIKQEAVTGQHAAYMAGKTTVPRIRTNVPVGGWQWRESNGKFHYPANMHTRHLFFTLRMIWNNFMPARMRVGAVTLYDFTGRYTRDYLKEAIYRIADELSRRDDMTAEWSAQLAAMRAWFNSPDLALAEGQLSLTGK
jgi:hypothetical protein